MKLFLVKDYWDVKKLLVFNPNKIKNAMICI